ncbi:MAG: ImmA/IrrE family metallo-endopeptidase [Hyphomicrobium sp.]
MTRAAAFQPDWTSPPGDTIAEILALRGYSVADFARRIDATIALACDLTLGVAGIDNDLAKRLEKVLGPSANFWLRREQQYRHDLARIAAGTTSLTDRDFLAQLPVADMRRFGWIDTAASKIEQLAACLRFFDVSSISAWQQRYRGEMAVAAFRTSPTFDANPYAVAAWLRWAEIASDGITCRPWDRSKFETRLLELKALSRIKDPARFLPQLIAICAECGVAVVVARAPKGCRASGATRFLTPSKALIVMSFRYRSDDQFWFTFFHEAAHLILHAKDAVFLEDGSEVTEAEEAEANEFAARVLVPEQFFGELKSLRPTLKEIVAFARKVGVAPGIVVGQLQHLGRVKPDRLNGFKRRYRWDTTSTPRLIP